jgi:hypothetical protein
VHAGNLIDFARLFTTLVLIDFARLFTTLVLIDFAPLFTTLVLIDFAPLFTTLVWGWLQGSELAPLPLPPFSYMPRPYSTTDPAAT